MQFSLVFELIDCVEIVSYPGRILPVAISKEAKRERKPEKMLEKVTFTYFLQLELDTTGNGNSKRTNVVFWIE